MTSNTLNDAANPSFSSSFSTSGANGQAYAALVLRLALGAMYLSHGLTKLLVFTPAGTAGFFESLGLPGFFGPLAMVAEIGAGILLILGVQTRLVSAALIPLLIGSIVLVHGANGWSFANTGGGWEYPLFLIATSLAQALLGNGAFNLQSRLFNRD